MLIAEQVVSTETASGRKTKNVSWNFYLTNSANKTLCIKK